MWSPIARVYDPLKAGSIDTTDEDPHDRAIIRALEAKYKPNKDVIGDPEKTVFVARLNPKTNEETLESVFSEYGEIERLRLVRDIVTGYSKSYAFIEYVQEKSATKAQIEANNIEIDGCEIFVDYECERTLKGWIPRRLGGGFGGKKESGQLRFGGKDRPFRRPINLDIVSKDTRRDRDNFGRREDRDRFNDSRSRRDRGFRGNLEREKYSRKNRSRSRDISRGQSKDRSKRHKRDRSKDRYRDRSKSRSRERSQGYRERSRDDSRSRGHSRDRSRDQSRNK